MLNIPPISKEKIGEISDAVFPFPNYNPGQREAIIDAVNAYVNEDIPHVIIDAPTGTGKSVIATTIHAIIDHIMVSMDIGNDEDGPRFTTTITTSTLGLQDQYQDIPHTNIADLKGRSNYKCQYKKWFGSSECYAARSRFHCCTTIGCPFIKARSEWVKADLRVTNTSLLVCTDHPTDLVVLDECHNIPSKLTDAASMWVSLRLFPPKFSSYEMIKKINEDIAILIHHLMKFNEGDVLLNEGDTKRYLSTLSKDVDEAKLFFTVRLEELSSSKPTAADDIKDHQNVKEIYDIISDLYFNIGMTRCKNLTRIIIDKNAMNGSRIKPVFAHEVAHELLFGKADYFLHMSATVCGADLYAKTVGIPKGYYHTITIDNPIPLDNRPVYYIPVVKMSARSNQADYAKMAGMIDQIVNSHLNISKNANGVIHTVSYKLADTLRNLSNHYDRMFILKDRHKINDLMKNEHGIILLSPACYEGYDWKGSLCDYQIHPKVPYKYLGDQLVKLQMEKFPESYSRDTVLTLIQAVGRNVRGITDCGVNYILDSNFDALLKRGGIDYCPKWFIDAVTYLDEE